MNVLYAEASPRPRPSEVTYIPRAPIREYDYYAILVVKLGKHKLPVPVLIEDLSTEFEFGGKVAVDASMGVGRPIVFIASKDLLDFRSQFMGYASSSSPSMPIVYSIEKLGDIMEAVKSKAHMASIIDVVAPSFSDELQEAEVAYAPSVKYRFLHRPLSTIAGKMAASKEREIDGLFWSTLLWRENVHEAIYRDPHSCLEELIELTPFPNKRSTVQYDVIEELKNTLSGCSKVEVHIAFPNLKQIVDLYQEILRVEGHIDCSLQEGFNKACVPSPIESLFFLVPAITSAVENMNKQAHPYVEIYVHHDSNYDRTVQDILECIRNELEGIYSATRVVGQLDMPPQFPKGWSEAYSERMNEIDMRSIKGFNEESDCIVLIVRDTAKRFLWEFNKKLRLWSKRQSGQDGGLIYIYMPEEIRIHFGRLINSIENTVSGLKTQSPRGQGVINRLQNSLSKLREDQPEMPTIGFLPVFKYGYNFLMKLTGFSLEAYKNKIYRIMWEADDNTGIFTLPQFPFVYSALLKSFYTGLIKVQRDEH